MFKVELPYKGVITQVERVEVKGQKVYLYNGKLLGEGRLKRDISLEGLKVGFKLEKGELELVVDVEEELPKEPSKRLVLSRERAYELVPLEFKLSLAMQVKPLMVFFERDGTPKTSFKLKVIEECSKHTKDGLFLAWWHIFTQARNEIALKNQSLIYKAMRLMRVKEDSWDELYHDLWLVFLRAVGMWEPEKGSLSTVAITHMKSYMQKAFKENVRYVSLDRPITEDSETTFADLLCENQEGVQTKRALFEVR